MGKNGQSLGGLVSVVDPETASFTVTIGAFEDKGAEWEIALWDVTKFLARPGGEKLTAAQQAKLSKRMSQLNKCVTIGCFDKDRQASEEMIGRLGREVEELLKANHFLANREAPFNFKDVENLTQICEVFKKWLDIKGLADLDSAFVSAWSTNPHAGEFIKGHRIVLAELGLCPYHGHVQRSSRLFEGN